MIVAVVVLLALLITSGYAITDDGLLCN
ncbi:hypothetical protein I5K98_18875 [Serratia marcescens]|nr:hypothetical protein [Serratia marcescens]MBH2613122.1 hypothetical protein [Serratia marcescens]MBN5331582.1 hypothetical protein [Serratia marcescens]HEJ7282254.1 hypothetical protein [Serratia marcescens]HEJ8117176.1 hypothetical protein [Serratia marcescens]